MCIIYLRIPSGYEKGEIPEERAAEAIEYVVLDALPTEYEWYEELFPKTSAFVE